MPDRPDPLLLSRRHALTLGGAAAASLAWPGFRRARADQAAQTQPAAALPYPNPRLQGAGYYRLSLGDVEVTLLSDGSFPFSPTHPTIGTNTTEANVRKALHDAFIPFDHVLGHVNALLINTGKRLILIDTGCGNPFGPTTGALRFHLTRLGADTRDIDTVVITHLHPDHIGGLITNAGTSWLPKARFVMHQDERAFWSANAPDLSKSGIPAQMQGFITGSAQTALQNIAGRLDLLSDKRTQLDPALAAYHTPGHTPGHLVLGLYGDAGQFGYMADLIHFAPVQFANPGWHIAFDTDPVQAADTRQRILAYYAEKRKPVSGAHLPFPAVGHVKNDGDAFAYVPVVWQWNPEASAPYQA